MNKPNPPSKWSKKITTSPELRQVLELANVSQTDLELTISYTMVKVLINLLDRPKPTL